VYADLPLASRSHTTHCTFCTPCGPVMVHTQRAECKAHTKHISHACCCSMLPESPTLEQLKTVRMYACSHTDAATLQRSAWQSMSAPPNAALMSSMSSRRPFGDHCIATVGPQPRAVLSHEDLDTVSETGKTLQQQCSSASRHGRGFQPDDGAESSVRMNNFLAESNKDA
jgi:hypothetical protein